MHFPDSFTARVLGKIPINQVKVQKLWKAEVN